MSTTTPHAPALHTAGEVAPLLRRSLNWFHLHHRRLTAELGFPPPVPGFGKPMLWARAAVLEWINRQVASAAPGDAAEREAAASRPAVRRRNPLPGISPPGGMK